MLTLLQAGAMLATIVFILVIGVFSGKKVKSAADFSLNSQKSGALIVAGGIMGTLVGGSSTIGTTQLAISFGFSAWWFTLGAALGCLVLGVVFVKPLRSKGSETIMQIINDTFGPRMSLLASVLSILGMLLMIVAQLLAGNALLTSILPINGMQAGIINILLMMIYVLFGGVFGTGMLGAIKMLLLYFAVLLSMFVIYSKGGGFSAYAAIMAKNQYFSLVARGAGIDIGAGLSVLLGVLSSQMYVQSIISAKSDRAARNGAFISAVAIPPMGLGSILIGMYMLLNFKEVPASNAFVVFIMEHLHPLIGGVILATLLITVVASGAGTALGISTIMVNNIYVKYISTKLEPKKSLLIIRATIVAVLLVCLLLTIGNLGSAILKWGFMSMALRATVVLAPLCAALFFPEKLSAGMAMLSSVLGTAMVVIGNILGNWLMDPLLIGMLSSILVVLAGVFNKRTKL